MKIFFLTGSSGFIGFHLVEALLEKEYFVKALVSYDINLSVGWLETIKWFKDKKNLSKYKKEYKV